MDTVGGQARHGDTGAPIVPSLRYFGFRWDAPVFDDAIAIRTPVGQKCGYCSIEIQAGDSGLFETFVITEDGAELRPVHIECFLRLALGSPAHLKGECSCQGQHEPDDARSWREQGKETMRLVEAERGRSMLIHQ